MNETDTAPIPEAADASPIRISESDRLASVVSRGHAIDADAAKLMPLQLAYAARDVAHLHPLRDVLSRELEQANLGEVAELEMELLPVVVAMEQTGIAVNRRDLERIERESKQKQTAVAAQLGEALSVPGLNPNSTDQLQSALNKAGVKVPNTSAEALKGSGDTCYVPRILEYRAAKSQAQQAASLIKCIAPDDRIHGRFEPTGTDTGRFSSRNPTFKILGEGRCARASSRRQAASWSSPTTPRSNFVRLRPSRARRK